MNITSAQTFLEVVRCGNLNRAARHLNVTQSTVTSRINALEDEMGQQLLMRNRSGAQLTSAGFKFQRYAEMLVQTWKQARHEVSLPSDFESACTLACHFDLWHGLGEIWCNLMRSNYPRVALSVWPGEHHDIARWLESSLIDGAIVYDMQPRAGWSMDVLSEDRLIEVATRKRSVVRWDPSYVYVDHGPEFRRQHAAAYPVEETPTVTFGQSDWALRHLLQHGGSGYLPQRLVREHIENGDLHEIDGAAVFSRTIHMICSDASRRMWPWFDASLSELRAHL